MNIRKIRQLFLVLCILPTWSSAAEFCVALKAEEMRAEPFGDAKPVAKLAVNDSLEILRQEGGWLFVSSSKGKGWVRMLSVRRNDAKKPGSTPAAALLGLNSGRAGSGKIVATTGIRGLNEEELKLAQFNETEIARAERYAATPAQRLEFSKQGQLIARPFDYLPEVK